MTGNADEDVDVIMTLFWAAALGPVVALFRIGKALWAFGGSGELEATARRASGRRVVRKPSPGADHPATIVTAPLVGVPKPHRFGPQPVTVGIGLAQRRPRVWLWAVYGRRSMGHKPRAASQLAAGGR